MMDKVQKQVTVTRADGTTHQRMQWVNADSDGGTRLAPGISVAPKKSSSGYEQGRFEHKSAKYVANSEFSEQNRLRGYYPEGIAAQLEETVTFSNPSEEASQYMDSLSEPQRSEVARIVNTHLSEIEKNDGQYSEDEFQRYSRELRVKLQTFEKVPEISQRSTDEIGEAGSAFRQMIPVQKRQEMMDQDFAEAKEVGLLPPSIEVSTELVTPTNGDRRHVRVTVTGMPENATSSYQRAAAERVESVVSQFDPVGDVYNGDRRGMDLGTEISYR